MPTGKRKTHLEYVSEVKEINPYIIPIETYINNKTKILHRCLKDGYEWKVIPNSILKGSGCPLCSKHKGGMKLSHDEYVKRVEKDYPSIEVLGEYKNTATKIIHRCKEHDYTWEVMPASILSGHGCPKCYKTKISKKNTKTDATFLQQVFEKVGEEYTFREAYNGLKKKLKISHNKCGNEYYVSPDHFLNRGFRCPKCCGGGAKKRKLNEEYKKDIEATYGKEYEVIGKYKNNKVMILHKHNECGYEYYARADQLLQYKHKCPICNPGTRQSTESIRFKVRKQTNGEYSVLSEYFGSDEKMLFRHNECGFEWESTPHNFIWNEARCPRCVSSKGEKETEQFLIKENIQYEKEYTFDDLRSTKGNLLRFDFALFSKNELIALVEYQGEQHYQPVDYFGGIESLEEQQRRDQIKRDFCKVNNIPLIEIPYWEVDVEKYLNDNLSVIAGDIQLSLL